MARMNDRGQMLLIGALVMAATFISLGVVLNGSLHTPSLAAEASGDVAGNELRLLENTFRREAKGLMRDARDEYAGSNQFGNRQQFVATRLTDFSDSLQHYAARQDQSVTLEMNPTGDIKIGHKVEGTVNPSDSLSFPAGEYRKFNIEDTSLSGSEQTTIVINDGTPTTITIDQNQVTVDGRSCSYDDQIEITNATTDRSPCEALDFMKRLSSSYDVTIRQSTGSGSTEFEFITNSNPPSGSYNMEEYIYEVNLDVTVHTPTVSYDGVWEVAPGEP